MGQQLQIYQNFKWTDLEQPSAKELETVTVPFPIEINLLEDSLQYGHLPKLEKLQHYTFIILRAHSENLKDHAITVGELSNKIAFFINEEQLLTIHRANFNFLSKCTDNYTSSEELMLDIINEMLLTYEQPLRIQNEKVEALEKEVFLDNSKTISIKTLYYQKSKARITKKILNLTLQVIHQIEVKPELNSTLQDLKETIANYILQYEEIIENSNTILSSYLSLTAQRNNDVMKLLTIFSAFFLPLTFIVGVYGMNFKNMPELEWHYGYFLILFFMVLISIIIYIWFKVRKIM
jgi:magnesium transporter